MFYGSRVPFIFFDKITYNFIDFPILPGIQCSLASEYCLFKDNQVVKIIKYTPIGICHFHAILRSGMAIDVIIHTGQTLTKASCDNKCNKC